MVTPVLTPNLPSHQLFSSQKFSQQITISQLAVLSSTHLVDNFLNLVSDWPISVSDNPDRKSEDFSFKFPNLTDFPSDCSWIFDANVNISSHVNIYCKVRDATGRVMSALRTEIYYKMLFATFRRHYGSTVDINRPADNPGNGLFTEKIHQHNIFYCHQ